MMIEESSPIRKIILIFFISLYVLLSAYVMLIFIASPDFGDRDGRITVSGMVHGTSYRPYVYRMVVPKLTELVVALTPAELESSMNDELKQNAVIGFIVGINPMAVAHIFALPDLLYTRFVAVLIMSGFIAGYVVVLYRLAAFLFPKQWAASLFAPIMGLVMVPACTYPALQIYDPAVLFFTTICYYYLAKQKWRHYLFWFFIATLNKETSVFITCFYCLYFFTRLPRKEFIRYLVIQILIYGYTKVGINFYYMGNPGTTLEDHFMRQVSGLLLSRYLLQDVVFVFISCYILMSRWQEKPVFARYGLYIAPIIYISYLWYGTWGEYRVFFDIFPLLALLITDTLVVGTGIAACPIFNNNVPKVSSPCPAP